MPAKRKSESSSLTLGCLRLTLIDDRKFRRLQTDSSSFTSTNVLKVDRIKEGHKFRKLAPHPCTKSSSTNDKSTKLDHISSMPDSILQIIISSLTVREGASTSILSTRWRYLWTASFSCLNFDIPSMLGYDYPNDMFKKEGKHILMDKRSSFVKWVNQVLELRPALELDALRVSLSWIKSPLLILTDGSSLQQLRESLTSNLILISTNFVSHSSLDLYEFPAEQVPSCLKHLHLNFCLFRLSPDFVGFTSLVTLSLSHIYVSQSTVDNILSKCPILQCLSLAYCIYESYTRLKFAGPSLVLKHLYIGATDGIVEIELHDVLLLSFELGGNGGSVSIKNAPHLARLVLSPPTSIKVLSNVPRLEILFLTQLLEKSIMPQSCALSNLKRLGFIANCGTTDLLGAVYLLEACPLLQVLELDMGVTELRYTTYYIETRKKLSSISGSPHYNLKEIEIYGFEAHAVRIELAKYLLKKAVVLEKMKIYTTSKEYDGNGNWSLYKGIGNWSLYKGIGN